MRTRSQKLALQNAGGLPSPPQQLPATQKRARGPKKKPSRAQQRPSIAAEDAKEPNSETTKSPLVPIVHPVRSPGRGRVPSTPPVAHATQPPTSPAPTVPKVPKVPQALIHVWVDAAAEDLASAQPVNDPNILLAVPSALIPNLLKFIAANTELTISPAITTISISPSSNKRKLPADADSPPAAQRPRIEPSPTPVRPKARKAFRQNVLAEEHLEPNAQPPRISHYQPSDTIPDTKFFRRVDRYTSDGRLQLGLEPVTISSEEGSNALFQPSRPFIPPSANELIAEEDRPPIEGQDETASCDHGPAPDTVEESGNTDNISTGQAISASFRLERGTAPETPRGNRWGFGSLVNTARRYLPSLNRRVEPMTPVAENPVIALNQTEATQTTQASVSTSPDRAPPLPPDAIVRPTLPDVAQSAGIFNPPATAAVTTATKERRRRKHGEKSQTASKKKGTKPKKHVQSDRRQWEEQEPQSFPRRSQAYQDLLDDMRRMAAKAASGAKRKRLPSPDSIPNPRGCSYGMDLDYFGYVSSDEDDEIENTPSKPRPSKSRRISKPEGSDGLMVGDPQNARPYSGVVFAESDPAYHGGNVFSEVKTTERATRRASETRANESQKQAYVSKTSSHSGHRVPPATPITNSMGSFKVPEPSDSESDSEESPRATAQSDTEKNSREEKGVPRQAEASTTTMAASSTGRSPELWNKSPPPRPTPSHKALPSAPKLRPSEPLSSPSHTTVSSTSGPGTSGSRLPAHHVAPPPGDRSTDSEALRKVREKALQHKPRKPSTLSQSSRINSSPVGDSSEEANDPTAHAIASAPKDNGRNKALAVQADRRIGANEAQNTRNNKVTAPPAGTIADCVSSDIEVQKNTGHNEVAAIQADTTSTGAGSVDGDHTDNQQRVIAPDRSPFNAYEEYCKTIDPEVARLLAKTEVDVNVVGDVFKAGISGFSTDAKENGKEVAVATTTTAVSTRLSNTRPPVNKFVADQEVMNFINAAWTKADEQLAVTVFEKLLADFRAKEEANTAAITAGVAV